LIPVEDDGQGQGFGAHRVDQEPLAVGRHIPIVVLVDAPPPKIGT
jgi:hypothetical protein